MLGQKNLPMWASVLLFLCETTVLMKNSSIQSQQPFFCPLSLPQSAPLFLRAPLTTHTNFWLLSPVCISFPICECFHTHGHLLQVSCLTQTLNPSALGQFLTILFTSFMRPGNNGVLLPLFFILSLPLHLSWHSWLHMVLLKLEIWSLQCQDYPRNDWRRGGSTDSFWLAKNKRTTFSFSSCRFLK